jgi:hypothetical protein
MPSLISGSTLRRGGSGQFIDLAGAQPQLPATATTETGFSLITDGRLITEYRSSLGFVEFYDGQLWAKKDNGIIRILATGTNFRSTSTQTGSLVVDGGIGVGMNMWIQEDIVVNDITIGNGYEQGYNNIVMRGEAVVPPDDHNNGQSSIAIGYNVLQGLTTSNRNIGIGRNALSTGTELRNNIAIGDSALKETGSILSLFKGTITNATQTSPVVLTTQDPHTIATGTTIIIYDVAGMTELNGNTYYANWINSTSIELYADNILSLPVDGSGFTGYSSSGTVNRILLRNNNIAIGTNAGAKLIDGEENFFFGGEIAKNLTTGSYNIFIGNDVAGNVTQGNGIISIGSDNLVDNKDNQVAIGSVFYYDGTGTAHINANTEVGIGTQSTSTMTGGLLVTGGAAVQRNLYIGEELHVVSTGTSTFFYGDVVPVGDNVSLGSSSTPFASLFLKGSTLYLSTVTLKSVNDTSFSVESPAGFVRQTVGNLTLNSGAASNAFNNGSLVVTGGAGIQGDVYVNGSFNVTGPELVDLSPAATVFIQPTLTGSVQIRPATVGNIDNMVIGANDTANGSFDSVVSTDLRVTNTTSSTSTTTGAVRISGGVGISGNVYSASGNPDENFLLYTPKSTISTSPPSTATTRIGDFWINPLGPYFLQYIQDGANRIWIQIGSA